MPIIVFRYLLKEVIPQFFTSLCVLSAVLVVSQLIRLADVLMTFGVSLENILMPFLFIILPFLSFTIPMAYMFAVLLTFGRLSADGEFTALLASGYSLKKAGTPIMVVAVFLYIVGALCALNLEPWGRREFVHFYQRKAQTELDNLIKFKLQSGVFLADFLGFVIYAENISQDRSRFDNVMLAPGKNMPNQSFTVLAPSGAITGTVETADLRMSFDYGVIYSTTPHTEQSTVVKFKRAEVDILRIFQEQIFGSDSVEDDYRSYPPFKLAKYINELKHKPSDDKKTYYKARFLLHQRISIPFAAVTFAFFAMVLGIQDTRRRKSKSYLGAVFTIICGYVVMMSFKWLAEQGKMSAPLAGWAPNILLALLGYFLVYQKNRLPPSESALDPRYIPWLAKIFPKKK